MFDPLEQAIAGGNRSIAQVLRQHGARTSAVGVQRAVHKGRWQGRCGYNGVHPKRVLKKYDKFPHEYIRAFKHIISHADSLLFPRRTRLSVSLPQTTASADSVGFGSST